MRRVGLIAMCFALVVGVLAGASLAGADEPSPEPAPVEAEPAPGDQEPAPEEAESAPEEAESAEEAEPAPEVEGVFEQPALLVGCSANFICIYSSTTYNNPYVAIQCGVGGALGMGGNRYSATNRCGNKTNWLRVSGSAIACMNPGGNRPHPGAFNEVYVAKEYGAFC